MDITRERFLEVCRQVQAEFPEGVNPMGENPSVITDDGFDQQCLYTKRTNDGSNAQPHCFIGTVMLRLGVPLPAEFESPNTLPPDLEALAGRLQGEADGFDQDSRKTVPVAWKLIPIPEA